VGRGAFVSPGEDYLVSTHAPTVILSACLLLPLSGTADEVETFCRAVEAGDLHRVAQQLARNPALATAERESDGAKPAHLAAWHGRRAVGGLLVAHGAEVDVFVAAGLGLRERAARLLEADSKRARARLWDWDTPLHFAVRNGHADVIDLLLDHGADLDARDEDGCSPLLRAVKAGRFELAKRLLDRGADVHTFNGLGETPLHRAVDQGNRPLAALLLAHTADPNAPNDAGNTPFHTAAQQARKRLARLLVAYGADVQARNHDGATPLHAAAGLSPPWAHLEPGTAAFKAELRRLVLWKAGDPKAVVELLLAHGADPDARTRYGVTPFDAAFTAGHLDLANYLADHGADVDVYRAAALGRLDVVGAFFDGHPACLNEGDRDGKTLLHWAAEFGRARVVRTLLNYGARVDVWTRERAETPLDCAARNGHRATVELLVGHLPEAGRQEILDLALGTAVGSGRLAVARQLFGHGAGISAADDKGRTPLHRAVDSGDPQALDWVLARHPDVNARDNVGRTALHDAAVAGDPALIERLLARGARADVADAKGWAALHLAANRGFGPVVRVLAAHGADVNARDRQGKTPLHVAAAFGQGGAVRALLASRADANARDHRGQTPLHEAVGRFPRLLMCGNSLDDLGVEFFPHYPADRRAVVEDLYNHGADDTARDAAGLTPRQLALSQGWPEFAELLKRYGPGRKPAP
jgi:cytohesin